MKVAIYVDHGKRSQAIGKAIFEGVIANKDTPIIRRAATFDGVVDCNIAIFYGLRGNLMNVYDAYKKEGRTAILVDLGYWNRAEGGKLSGYHKVTVNNFHPNAYFQKIKHGDNRFKRLGVKIKPRQTSGHSILVAGMSEKAAGVYNYGPQEFEEKIIKNVRGTTVRPIIYRPKPTWLDAKPIKGTIFSPPEQSLDVALSKSALVITHHSNVAIDAILAGVPCRVLGDGVGKAVSDVNECFDKEFYFPDDEKRQQWLNDISYVQWKVEEIRNGLMWRHLKEEELI